MFGLYLYWQLPLASEERAIPIQPMGTTLGPILLCYNMVRRFWEPTFWTTLPYPPPPQKKCREHEPPQHCTFFLSEGHVLKINIQRTTKQHIYQSASRKDPFVSLDHFESFHLARAEQLESRFRRLHSRRSWGYAAIGVCLKSCDFHSLDVKVDYLCWSFWLDGKEENHHLIEFYSKWMPMWTSGCLSWATRGILTFETQKTDVSSTCSRCRFWLDMWRPRKP